MATADAVELCAVQRPASRRFYVHVGSLGFLVAAQPSIYAEVAHALALSGASRALDQAVQDLTMLAPGDLDPSLAKAAGLLHDEAADALRLAFQCIVQLVPPRFGATALLLGPTEQLTAWCYEDGYLTYATDEDAAAIMYAETGSLRRLRSEIRRSPGFDPALEMISGQSLFLYDQREGTGAGTALFYKRQAARLLRSYNRASLPLQPSDPRLAGRVEPIVAATARTFEGEPVIASCLSRGRLMVATLLRSLPPVGGASVN
ncbi:MAG TPA: hypothetical protein VMG38_14730 [Trebonia sp.]|nr:hypothetical protein [Trebonia sp.]